MLCRASLEGKHYYEPYDISPEAAVEVGLALLLRAKVGGGPWAGKFCMGLLGHWECMCASPVRQVSTLPRHTQGTLRGILLRCLDRP